MTAYIDKIFEIEKLNLHLQVLLLINHLFNKPITNDMTAIYCSRKLETFINTETIPEEINPYDREWSAHLVAIGGRKCVCMVDKKTLYGILLIDVLKKDLPTISSTIYLSFIQQLKGDRIYNPELDGVYSRMFSSVRFFKTDNDRKSMGILNGIIDNLKSYCNTREDKLEAALYFARNTMNGIPFGTRKYKIAKEMMKTEMEEWLK